MRKFYAPAPEGADSPTACIVIHEGEAGYYPTAQVFTPEHCDKINALNGTTPAQVEAAILCSMFGCWQNFDKITAAHEERERDNLTERREHSDTMTFTEKDAERLAELETKEARKQ